MLIYWHVETKSVVVHSQLLNCTASEVAAMIDGAIHHGTEMDVKLDFRSFAGCRDERGQFPVLGSA